MGWGADDVLHGSHCFTSPTLSSSPSIYCCPLPLSLARAAQELHGLLLEGDGVDGALGRDPQFGPPWAQLPCGGAAIPGEAKH